MKKSRVLLVLTLFLVVIYPSIKGSVYDLNTEREDYVAYYNSMIEKGSWSDEEHQEFKSRAESYESSIEAELDKNTTYAMLLMLAYLIYFAVVFYNFVRRKDLMSSAFILLLLVVFFAA